MNAESQNQDIPTLDTDDYKLTKQNIYKEQAAVLPNDLNVCKDVCCWIKVSNI